MVLKNSLRYFILVLILFYVESLYSQQVVPWNKIREINNQIRNISCSREGVKANIDGPIEIEKWYNGNLRSRPSDLRILFLLKEAYGSDTLGVDLSELRRFEKSLLDMDSDEGRPTYAPMVDIVNMLVLNQNYEQVHQQVKSVGAYTIFKECSAIVEVKKEYGESKSYNSDIKNHARKNKELIKKQIEVYNPNVVILCGNNIYEGIFVTHDNGHMVFGDLANDNANLRVHPQFKYYYNDRRIYINTYHPSARVNKSDYCTEIVEVVRQWMEDYVEGK